MAALPLIFGAHQLIEMVIWRNAGDDMHTVRGTAVLLWIIIAFPLLPAYVPLAVMSAASSWSRVRVLPFVVIGLATSAVLVLLMTAGPLTAQPVGHTMQYGLHHIRLENLPVAGYLVATLGALVASDQPEIRLLGLVSSVGAVVCYSLWANEFVSTWCALAAVASVVVLYWLRRPKKRRAAPDPLRRSRAAAH